MKLTKDNDTNSGCPVKETSLANPTNSFFSPREANLSGASSNGQACVSRGMKTHGTLHVPLLNVSPRAYLPRYITEWQIKCKYRRGGIIPRQILRAYHKKNRLKYGGIESKALHIPDSLKVAIERRICDRVYSESLYLSRCLRVYLTRRGGRSSMHFLANSMLHITAPTSKLLLIARNLLQINASRAGIAAGCFYQPRYTRKGSR